MSKFIITDGDEVKFLPAFQGAIVTVKPGKITGTGISKIRGNPICVKSDFSSVEVENVQYITPSHPQPGFGTLKIKKLKPNQVAKKYKCGGEAVILKGIDFVAEFVVDPGKGAKSPPPANAPDGKPSYNGKGVFVNANKLHKGA